MLEWLVLHFCIGVAGTWLARRYALKQALIDEPGERRSHSVATPRGGGIAIVISLLVAALALGIRQPPIAPLMLAFGTGLLLVAGIGWFDDHRPLSPWVRLAVHIVAAGLFAFAVGDVFQSVWLGACAFVATLVLTNVWNFMDGINGIAAGQALVAALGLAWMAGGSWGLLALALAAACAGFLPFNFPRARIFMGIGAGLGTAAAKELWDRSHSGTPSWRDFTWGAVGTAAGVAVSWLIDRARRPRSQAYAFHFSSAVGP